MISSSIQIIELMQIFILKLGLTDEEALIFARYLIEENEDDSSVGGNILS